MPHHLNPYRASYGAIYRAAYRAIYGAHLIVGQARGSEKLTKGSTEEPPAIGPPGCPLFHPL